MWLSDKVFDLFHISNDAMNALREDLASTRTERDMLKSQLVSTQIMSDWLRMQVNTLQIERTSLMEKAYNIKLPVPELAKAPSKTPTIEEFTFEDIGEDLARKFGMPAYEPKQ